MDDAFVLRGGSCLLVPFQQMVVIGVESLSSTRGSICASDWKSSLIIRGVGSVFSTAFQLHSYAC